MPGLPVYKHWPADMVAKSTPELVRMYDRGFQGAFKDPEAEEALFASLNYKTFADVAHEHDMAEDGKGKLSVCFELVRKFNPQEYPGKPQRTGCCVSRSTVNAFTPSYAYEVWNGIPDDMKKKLLAAGSDGVKLETIFSGGKVAERWPSVPHPEHQTFDHVTIYGERGHRSQGANCGTLARAARDHTGLMPRGVHDIPGYGKYDCSLYNDTAAARSGPHFSEAFRKYANKHHVRDVTSCPTTDEARDALANHYGLSVCSGFACSSVRPVIDDGDGPCAGPNEWRGSWAHAMAWLACDDRPWAHKQYGGPLFLVCNSWGSKWHTGPSRIWGTNIEIPPGCFWITWRSAKSMLRGGGGHVLSNVKGFPRRPLVISWW